MYRFFFSLRFTRAKNLPLSIGCDIRCVNVQKIIFFYCEFETQIHKSQMLFFGGEKNGKKYFVRLREIENGGNVFWSNVGRFWPQRSEDGVQEIVFLMERLDVVII